MRDRRGICLANARLEEQVCSEPASPKEFIPVLVERASGRAPGKQKIAVVAKESITSSSELLCPSYN